MKGLARWVLRGQRSVAGRILIIALILASLNPAGRAPSVDAQDLSSDDQTWITQRILEAGIYIGGGIATPNTHPEEMVEFEDWYRDCLSDGLLDGNARSATLDLCAEMLISPLWPAQDWFDNIDDIVLDYLGFMADQNLDQSAVDASVIELRDCLKGLSRTRFLDEDEAVNICGVEARNRLIDALLPPTPTPLPTVQATPVPQGTPRTTPGVATPGPSPTAGPGTAGEVVYRANVDAFVADNAHLTWINAGPVDTRLTLGNAEVRLDGVTARMRGPATIRLTLVADNAAESPLCSHSRLELTGTAPITDGSAAADEGMVINFDGTLVRTFEGQNCPPEREFRSQGPVTSLRLVIVQDNDRNENVVALCSLALLSSSRDDCRRAAIAVLTRVP